MKYYNQVELLETEGPHHTRMVCWLEEDPRIKIGVKLTLKELAGREWFVSKLYTFTAEGADLHKPWKVGGIK